MRGPTASRQVLGVIAAPARRAVSVCASSSNWASSVGARGPGGGATDGRYFRGMSEPDCVPSGHRLEERLVLAWCSSSRQTHFLMRALRDSPFPFETVRDLLGILRMMYAAHQREGRDERRLRAI